MIQAWAALLVAIVAAGDDPAAEQVRELFATIESLQKPVEDFRCEFEQTIHFKGKLAEQNHVGKDGLFERASGVYIWKAGGDIRVESLVASETLREMPDIGAVAWHGAAMRRETSWSSTRTGTTRIRGSFAAQSGMPNPRLSGMKGWGRSFQWNGSRRMWPQVNGRLRSLTASSAGRGQGLACEVQGQAGNAHWKILLRPRAERPRRAS